MAIKLPNKYGDLFLTSYQAIYGNMLLVDAFLRRFTNDRMLSSWR